MKLNGNKTERHGEEPEHKSQPEKQERNGAVFARGTDSVPDYVRRRTPQKQASDDATPPSEKASPQPAAKKKRLSPMKVIAAVLVFLALAVSAYALWERPPKVDDTGPKLQNTPAPTPVATSDIPTSAEPTPQPEKKPSGRNENCYTFLITAMDQVGANTDTILVGRMDVEKGTLDFVNIPRDTLVNVSWGVKKVNTILVAEDNDPDKMIEKLSDLLGFTIDCYAMVNIRAVEKLVDCIGGVYYNVPRSMDYDDPSQDFYVHIPAGYQWLNGENAVKVLRFRVGNDNSGYANGDLGRIATQQDFLMSIAAELLKAGNLSKLPEVIDIFEQYVTTNMTGANLAYFARQFFLLDKDAISFHTEPGEGISIRYGSYYMIDVPAWVEMINSYLNPYFEDIQAENLSILQYGSNGVYATNGEVAGGAGSFYDFSTYNG